jgi:hypothetical protein
MMVEVNEEKLIVHPIMQPLLQEFKDVIPKETPIGLPLIRDIQSCIDLIPRSM